MHIRSSHSVMPLVRRTEGSPALPISESATADARFLWNDNCQYLNVISPLALEHSYMKQCVRTYADLPQAFF